MTPSFQETKTWGRSSKHHYNDILTNMQSIIQKSGERRKHTAHCTCCWSNTKITKLTPTTNGWMRKFFCWQDPTDCRHSPLCFSPSRVLTELFQMASPHLTSPLLTAERLLPSLSQCQLWPGSLPAACVASCGSTKQPESATNIITRQRTTLYRKKLISIVFRILKILEIFPMGRNIYFLLLGGYAGEVTRLGARRDSWQLLLLIFCLLTCSALL